jgi:hypothetical protein
MRPRFALGYHCFQMARHSIIEKLATHLAKPVTTGVVYLLVELRKMLEHDGTKNKFPVLNFHCNWVVHTKLSDSAVAEKIVRHFDELPNLLEKVENGHIPISAEMEHLINQELLREELRECLASYDLPTTPCSDDWIKFSDALCRVIEDCPLEIRAPSPKPAKPPKEKEPTKYVESVVVARIPNVERDGRGMEWKLKFHTNPRIHVDKDGRVSHIPRQKQP